MEDNTQHNDNTQNNNTMIHELNGLETIEVNSRRGKTQRFDLEHDPENRRFKVSDAFYAKEKMNDNGFTAHTGHGNAYLSIQSNEESVSYKGKEGHDKGKEFTSTVMSDLFEKMGLVGKLKLEEIGQKDNATYYRVEQAEDSDDSEDEETITEEMVAQ